MDRRDVLVAGGASLATALAGCLDGTASRDNGNPAGGIRLESLDVRGSPGGKLSIRPRERVVLLDFFATWCAPCKPEMANLRAARKQFPSETVFMVSITQETDEATIKQFWTRYEGTWPVVMDPDLTATKEYGITGIPTIIVLTPDGTEMMRHVGLAGQDKIISNIRNALRQAGMA